MATICPTSVDTHFCKENHNLFVAYWYDKFSKDDCQRMQEKKHKKKFPALIYIHF